MGVCIGAVFRACHSKPCLRKFIQAFYLYNPIRSLSGCHIVCFYKAPDISGLHIIPAVRAIFQDIAQAIIFQYSDLTRGLCFFFIDGCTVFIRNKCIIFVHLGKTEFQHNIRRNHDLLMCDQLFISTKFRCLGFHL